MVTRPRSSAVVSEDKLLVRISALAHRFAHRKLRADLADDIAQDIVVACLVRLRDGRGTIDRRRLPGLVRSMLHYRMIDQFRWRQRDDERHAEHLRDLTDSTHAWMSPDLALEEEELEQIRQRTLASLPYKSRYVYEMVRERNASYRATAAELGVARSTVSARVAAVDRRLRDELFDYQTATSTHRSEAQTAPVAAARR